jgi:hypothetical protein
MTRDNIISFGTGEEALQKRPTGERRKKTMDAVRGLVGESLPRLMQGLVDNLDDELYDLADKSDNDVLQTRYFEVMRELRKLSDTLKSGFLEKCFQRFEEFWAQDGERPAPDQRPPKSAQDLALVGEEELEEKLAINGMVSKAESRFHQELFALNLRFAVLSGQREVTDARNPLGPRALSESFAEALQCWPGEISFRLLIYKLFDRYVMAYTGGLYDEINDMLVAEGVLPKIQHRVRRNPVAPALLRARDPQSDQHTADQEPRPYAGPGATGGATDNEILSVLSKLLLGRRQSVGAISPFAWAPSETRYPDLPEVSTEDLFDALSAAQDDVLNTALVSPDALQATQAELLGSLGRRLSMGSPAKPAKRLGRVDQDVLDVMGLLFDFILNDKDLPDGMKALLARLQIPMLKVAVADRRFFSDRQHPARLLLNNLARAAGVWNDDGDHSAGSLYGRIEAAVNHVLLEFDDDIEVFEAANREFNRYLEHEERNAELAEKRVSQVKHGQEQLEVARRRVDEVIGDHLGGCHSPDCEVPDNIRAILNEAWRDVLLLAYLREGEQSAAWAEACGVVRDLVWSVQPKSDQAERQNLLSAIPGLLQRVREGLVNISFDQHRSAALLRDLQTCHIAALRGAKPDSAGAQAVEKPQAEQREAGQSEVQGREEAEQGNQNSHRHPQRAAPKVTAEPAVWEDRYYEMAQALDVGQWLEWEGTDGQWIRGKLSWRSAITESCIFVNGKGMKVQEMSLVDIAARLRSHTARILENVETPLMDRALDAMLDTLRRTEEAPPRED